MNKKEGTNYGKILAVTLAVVAGACTVIWFALKLYRKYCLLDDYDDEEFDIDLPDDCEVIIEGEQEDGNAGDDTDDAPDSEQK